MKLSPKRLKEVREFAAGRITGFLQFEDDLTLAAWVVSGPPTARVKLSQAIRTELRRLAAELRKGGKK